MTDPISLDAFRVFADQNIFGIGLGDSLVTIYGQQVRSICLAHLLTEANTEENRDSVAIIGAGISGLTVSLKLLLLGWRNIYIYERLPDLLAIQNGCDTRWIHPHIIDWPDEGSENENAGLDILDWTASTASNVSYQMERNWHEAISKLLNFATKPSKVGRPERKLSVSLGVTYLRINSIRDQIEVQWLRDSRIRPIGFKGSKIRNSGLDKFRFLILATGFGIEKHSRSSYWRNEDIGQCRIDGITQPYIVSGLGDGAISDLLRLTTKNFRTDRAISHLNGLRNLKESLAIIKRQEKAAGSTGLFMMLERHSYSKKCKANWKALFEQLKRQRREDTHVYLYYRGSSGFALALNESKASFLHRVLLYSLFRNGAFQFVDALDADSAIDLAKKLNISEEYIIARHGIKQEDLLKQIFFSADGIALSEQPIDSCEKYMKKVIASSHQSLPLADCKPTQSTATAPPEALVVPSQPSPAPQTHELLPPAHKAPSSSPAP
jgi:hypothetical protein